MFELDFTGERVVPGKVDDELWLEHVSRYRFAARFVRGRKVLDFGCGTGYGAAILRRAGARRVVGSDRSVGAIRFALERYRSGGSRFCVADCEAASFPSSQFDVVVSFELIEHLDRYTRFLEEVRRVLKPDGIFLVSTPDTQVYRRESGVRPNPFHVHEFAPQELREALEDVFPRVEIFGQSRTEGVFFRRLADGDARPWPAQRDVRLDSGAGGRHGEDNGAAPYLLAVCTAGDAALDRDASDDFFHVAETDAVRSRDQRILELQAELDERLRWASGLQDESSRRGQRIVELQNELEERTTWAQDLERQSEERGRRILELQAELEERLRWATSVDKERQQRGQRIQELQGELDLLGRSIQRLSGLEDRFDGQLRQAEQRTRDELAVIRAEQELARDEARLLGEQSQLLGDQGKRLQDQEQILRWQRDSLIRQQQELDRLRDAMTETQRQQAHGERSQERRKASLQRVLDRQQRTLDGIERQVSAVSQQMERHQVEHAYWSEQTQEVELSASRARQLVDLLWNSRSWRMYTWLRRGFGTLAFWQRPRALAPLERPAAQPTAAEEQPEPRPRALIVDHRMPTPDQDAGSLRMVELIEVLKRLGLELTFLPENLFAAQPYCRQLENRDVEVIVTPEYTSARSYLAEHGRGFDLVIISRFHIATDFIHMVRELCPEARVVFDTVDLQFLRLERRAEIEADPELLADAERARTEELSIAMRSDATLVVSTFELELLQRELPGHDVHLVSLIHSPRTDVPGYDQREGFYFVGGFEHPPNVDAVLWLVEKVLPTVRRELPGATLYLLGSKAPESIQALDGDGIRVCGHVRDLEPYLTGCRLSLAPLRYGAGIKGKVTQSLAEGLPSVMTSVAAEGIGLRHGIDGMIADDPEDFARSIIDVYRDRTLWEALSRAGRERILQQFSPQVAEVATRDLCRSLEIDLPELEPASDPSD